MPSPAPISKPFRLQLDLASGVPVYRQLIDQVQSAIAIGTLAAGHQLPTVRQVAVDLAINPNTVMRAYRELEIRGVLETQQGTGTFVSARGEDADSQKTRAQRERLLDQLVGEFTARAGSHGFTIRELLERLKDVAEEPGKRRKP